MKFPKLYNRFSTLFLVFIFAVGIQVSADAQLRVWNNTNCTVFLKNGQHTGGCTLCNPSGIFSIPPNGVVVFPPSVLCGPEQWLAVKWYTTAGGAFSVGVSYNPVLACGANMPGSCGGVPINGNWLLTSAAGTGPATVIIQ